MRDPDGELERKKRNVLSKNPTLPSLGNFQCLTCPPGAPGRDGRDGMQGPAGLYVVLVNTPISTT